MTSIDLTTVDHHPVITEISNLLATRTRNQDLPFFRVIVAYFAAVVASTMRAKLSTQDRGEIPVNAFAVALSPSGTGKGFSVSIMENDILSGFRSNFVENTLPVLAECNLRKLANQRAARNNSTEDDEYDGLNKEYQQTGAYPFVFDKGSDVAIKQIRQKLLLANCGSINLQIDEIGSNLVGSTEALNAYLELYDQGMIKAKITKNTNDNKRTEEIHGKTPANTLLFGTPSKLLNGSKTEQEFYDFLETGYARRCFFGMGHPIQNIGSRTPAEEYAALVDPTNSTKATKWATLFTNLADISKHDWLIDVPDAVAIELLAYRMDCEKLAEAMPEHAEIQKAEMSHRYFKALKLAGAFAFIDEVSTLSMFQLHAAIKLVEESGVAFKSVLNREKTYMKLARYIAAVGSEVTHADLLDALPFYKSGTAARNELLTMATAWGYKHHIMLKQSFNEFGIELFSGETLKETSLDELTLSYSNDFAEHYSPESVKFSDLPLLTQETGLHWANHHFHHDYRLEENIIEGFNMVVIDVDGGTRIETVQKLLKEYTFLLYTTKRSTDADPRFRLIMPTNYRLKLNQDDYKDFMAQIAEWLPFQSDEEANQRSRKWLTNPNGKYLFNLGGNLIDVLPFVPKTSKNEHYRKTIISMESLDNLERWFAQKFASGSRNNSMIKFALALVDSGLSYVDVESRVIGFNKKLPNGLSTEELRGTVLVTVAKKIQGSP